MSRIDSNLDRQADLMFPTEVCNAKRNALPPNALPNTSALGTSSLYPYLNYIVLKGDRQETTQRILGFGPLKFEMDVSFVNHSRDLKAKGPWIMSVCKEEFMREIIRGSEDGKSSLTLFRPSTSTNFKRTSINILECPIVDFKTECICRPELPCFTSASFSVFLTHCESKLSPIIIDVETLQKTSWLCTGKVLQFFGKEGQRTLSLGSNDVPDRNPPQSKIGINSSSPQSINCVCRNKLVYEVQLGREFYNQENNLVNGGAIYYDSDKKSDMQHLLGGLYFERTYFSMQFILSQLFGNYEFSHTFLFN